MNKILTLTIIAIFLGVNAHADIKGASLNKISEKVSVNSKIFQWFNCVAYSTLAALLGRMIMFPAGVLAESELFIRIAVLIICIIIFIVSKKNLVLPTIVSAILLSILNSI